MLDNYDISILKEFYKLKESKETTTWEIMKRIHENGWNREHIRLKSRVKKMAEYGLFFVNGDKRRTYTLILDNVVFKRFNFPDKTCNAVCLKINGKWEIYEF